MLPGVATRPLGGGGGGSDTTIWHTLPAGQVVMLVFGRLTVALIVRSVKAVDPVTVTVVVALPLALVLAVAVVPPPVRVAVVVEGFLLRLKVTVAPFTAAPPAVTLAVMVLVPGGVMFRLLAERVMAVVLAVVAKAQA